jgi:hypothetical protein
MSCVKKLLKGVQGSCNAIKKIGGLDKRIYAAAVESLAAIVFGADNSITSFTFKDGEGFVKYIGKKEKNNAGSDVEVGENVNIRRQTVNMALYYETAEDLASIDDLIDQEGIFMVVETLPGTLEVFGINKTNFNSFGLKVTANPGTSGVVMNDSTAFLPTLSGGFTNLQLIYNPAGTLAANIAALDLQTIHGNES